MVVPECRVKAAEFDKKHREAARSYSKNTHVKKHAGAQELAQHYTAGEYDHGMTPLAVYKVRTFRS